MRVFKIGRKLSNFGVWFESRWCTTAILKLLVYWCALKYLKLSVCYTKIQIFFQDSTEDFQKVISHEALKRVAKAKS